MGFSRQEYWSGLPCPPPGAKTPPGYLLDPEIRPTSPALQADSLPLSHLDIKVYLNEILNSWISCVGVISFRMILSLLTDKDCHTYNITFNSCSQEGILKGIIIIMAL